MALIAGLRLGPYEILSVIGAGGMGEVYKARDTRLERVVAVKVLPSHLSESPEVQKRFEREAKTVSALSHPHICALYDVGSQYGVEYLVMEYLQGETLLDRLARGPLPIPETLRVGVEIADALDKAHEQGIVHRDLKPGNVMLTKSGVKLLDFGLAKSFSEKSSSPSAFTGLPTAAPSMTQEGAILGTVQYMAPEQVEGKLLDGRTDIFAFGLVLFEMISGRKAFTGSSRAALISSILKDEPASLTLAEPSVPPALDRLVRICLAKDPAKRWKSAHDVALQLVAMDDAAASAELATAGGSRARSFPWVPWAAAMLLAAIAAAALWKASSRPTPSVSFRFLLPPPENAAFAMTAEGVETAVSPDGSRIAFMAQNASTTRIFLRALSDAVPRPIAGTEGATSLFFSPDGKSIGFFAQDKLKRVDLAGGVVVPICEVGAPIGRAGSWGADGQILFAAVQGDAIYDVASDGSGPARPLVKSDPATGAIRVVWPWFLPDGRRFLYLRIQANGERALMLQEPGKSPRVIAPIRSRAEYVGSGHLLYVREGVLLAQPFDVDAGRIAGAPFPIAPAVAYFHSTGWGGFASSSSGTVVYQSHDDVNHLSLFDRSGRTLSNIGPPGKYLRVRFSPDGKRLAFARALRGLGTYDIWTLDLDRGTETPVTTDPENSEFGSEWFPDGKSLIYSATHGTRAPQLFWRDLSTGRDTPLLPSAAFQEALDVSRDGKMLLFAERHAGGGFELWTLPLSGDRRPERFPYRAINSETAVFSPDGTAVAFLSEESGQTEAFVAPLAPGGERTRISTDGALALRWNAPGRNVVLEEPGGGLESVAVATRPTLEAGHPKPLFVLDKRAGRGFGPKRSWGSFDISPDGQRFVAVVPDSIADEQPLTVIVHWRPETGR